MTPLTLFSNMKTKFCNLRGAPGLWLILLPYAFSIALTLVLKWKNTWCIFSTSASCSTLCFFCIKTRTCKYNWCLNHRYWLIKGQIISCTELILPWTGHSFSQYPHCLCPPTCFPFPSTFVEHQALTSPFWKVHSLYSFPLYMKGNTQGTSTWGPSGVVLHLLRAVRNMQRHCMYLMSKTP